MPDPKNSKSPKAPIVKYKGAEKVNYDPTTKGYNKQETIGDKTFYDKKANTARSGGKAGDSWKKTIISQLNSGVSPEELVKKGHIDPSKAEEFRQYYKPVYTQPVNTTPQTTTFDPAIGTRSAMRLLPKTTATQPYDTYEVPNLSGQVNTSEQILVDPTSGNVIDKDKYLKTGDLTNSFSGKTLDQYRQSNVRSDAQGATNLPTMMNGLKVTGSTLEDPLLMKPKGDKQGTVTSSTSGGFKNGGIIGKIKGYADGGQTSDNSKQIAGLAGMGAGIAGEYGGQALDREFMDEQGRYKRNPEIDKYSPQGLVSNFYNKGTLAGGVKGAGKGAALGASLGPEGALIGAGVGLFAGSVAGTLKANKDAKSIRADFDAMKQQDILNEQAKKQAVIDSSLNKQLTDRELGYKNGGKIEGAGTGKSDSITAKIKPNSFVIPAENSATAEVIRKVILKAPVKKANLNQGDGTKVKLSNGEHLFTPKEVEKVEKAGINLNELAPNRELQGDKQQLIRQKELLGFEGGGRITKRKNSTGNKSFDSELDKISEKEYSKTEDVDSDIKKLNDLNDKNYSLYGKYDNEISNHIRELNKIKPIVKGYINTAKGNSEMDSEIESTKKFLKENGASDIDIMAYEGKVKGLKKQIFDYKKDDAKKEALQNVLERKSKSNSESDKNELKTKAASFYNNKLIEATKNLELSKQNPQSYNKDQINKFKDDVEHAKSKILDVNSAANEGGMKLVRERDLYRKLSNTSPNTETKKSNTLKAPIAKKETNTYNSKKTDSNIPNINYLGGDSNKPITPSDKSKPIVEDVKGVNSDVNTTNTGLNITSPNTGQYPKPKSSNKPITKKEIISPDYLGQKEISLFQPEKADPLTGEIFEKGLYLNRTPEETADYNKTTTPILGQTSSTSGLGLDIAKIGDVAMGAIPFAQTAFGLSQLKKQGKRPVDSLDEDYLKSIDSARGNLNLLNADAKFGFTPEEQAMINNENQNLTNAQRYSARNLSGGSAGNAYNLERGAINNAFDRALKTKVQNRALMMEKQGIARDQQKYVDELVASKAAANRRLFGDEMNAFQQNQQAASGLVGAGLNNIIQGKRYADELASMKQTGNIRNSWLNSLPK